MEFRKKIDKILELILIVLMGVLVINVLWQVISRYLLKSPSSFTDELARFLLIWVGILGAGYAAGKKLHLAIDILPSKLSEKRKVILDRIIYLLVGLFAASVMVVGGLRLVYITLHLQQTSPSLKLPMGLVYIVIPLSGLLIVYYCVSDIILLKKKSRTKGEINKN
ncbi:TRAP transporter small permease [Bacteroidota bacterium]